MKSAFQFNIRNLAIQNFPERVNGILKYEYGLKEKFENKQAALTACRQAVKLYNSDRPHLSLGMKTPDMVHRNVYTNH